MQSRGICRGLSGLIILLVCAGGAEGAKVITRGRAKPDIETVGAGGKSTGSVCVRSAAGGVQNQGVSTGLVECTIEQKEVIGKQTFTTTIKPSKGRTDPKFVPDPNNPNKLLPEHADAVSRTAINEATTKQVVAFSSASWDSFVGIRSFKADLEATGDVTREKDATAGGFAAAEAKDPFVLDFSTSDLFGFNFSWGTTTINIDPMTGLPISELSLFSDDPNGQMHLDFRAGFTGVMFNGVPLDGDLFVLTIDARGIVSSLSNLDIQFVPWSGLGLTSSDIDDFVSYFSSKLTVLSDGSVGLAPGIEFPLVGPGSPIPTLTFQVNAGEVTNDDATVAVAQAVPETSTAFLLGYGLAILAWWKSRGRAWATSRNFGYECICAHKINRTQRTKPKSDQQFLPFPLGPSRTASVHFHTQNDTQRLLQ